MIDVGDMVATMFLVETGEYVRIGLDGILLFIS